MTSNQKGKLTEAKVLEYVLGLGYSVSIPFGDKERYDQIWDINGNLIRVQVKTSSLKDENAIHFSCRSISNGRTLTYSKKDIDYFATYWNNQVYLVPVGECSNTKTLRFAAPNAKTPISTISWAKNYEMEEVLKIMKV